MLSLKVFDRSHCEETLDAYRRAARLILETLVHQGIAGDESDLVSFRESVADAINHLSSPESKARDVLVAAGAATTAIHEYNRHLVTAMRAHRLELEAVVGMLTETMTEVMAGSGRSLARLREIERGLVRSQEMFDVRELRQKMAECLANVREEAACRKKESDRLIADLKAAATPKHAPVAPVRATPPAVEPPSEDSALETLIGRAAGSHPSILVAVLAIDHLKTIAARFGPRAAGQVADYCVEQAKAGLNSALHVMVWKGSACIALFDSSATTASAVEWSVSHEAQQRRSLSLDVGQRDVMLHVSYTKWTILPASGRPPAAVVQSMNEFLAQPAVPAPKHA